MTSSCRITDDWLPLPEPLLRALGWREGQTIELEAIDGVLVATPVGACGVVGEPPLGKKDRYVCELPVGHEGQHQEGPIRWLGYAPGVTLGVTPARRKRNSQKP